MNYLIIHKKEWDRIKRLKKPTNNFKREEYFTSLIEQSQEIIKKWNDSVQGHMNKLEKQKQMKNAKAIQTVKDFHLRKELKNRKDVIKKAKDLIFQDSCYGRQLLSALLESKALEEREAQIKFQLELKKKSEDLKNIEPKATSLPIDTELEEQQRTLKKKQINLEIAQINKALYENTYKEIKEKRDKEKQQELENEKWVKEISKTENILQTEIFKREQQEIEKYEKQNKEIKKARAEAAEKEDLIREVWRKYDEKIICREKSVFDKIHKESFNETRSKTAYKIIEQLNNEKHKKYNDFIQTGIKQHEKRLNTKDQQDIESKTFERNKRKLLDKDNKLLMEFKQQIDLNNDSNCRAQSLYVQGIPVSKETTSRTAERANKQSFLGSHNKLLKSLKPRDDKSKNALNEAHAQFAKHASDTLRQCRYKNMARKVIEDYRRKNFIDEKILPISD